MLITEFKELNSATKRINELEDLNAICKISCDLLTAENNYLIENLPESGFLAPAPSFFHRIVWKMYQTTQRK